MLLRGGEHGKVRAAAALDRDKVQNPRVSWKKDSKLLNFGVLEGQTHTVCPGSSDPPEKNINYICIRK